MLLVHGDIGVLFSEPPLADVDIDKREVQIGEGRQYSSQKQRGSDGSVGGRGQQFCEGSGEGGDELASLSLFDLMKS